MVNNYNDSHRLFVQAMLSRRIVTEEAAKQLQDKVREVTETTIEEDYNNFISTINSELDTLDYALKIVHEEVKGDRYLALVNVKQDSLTQIATLYTPAEISYIKELLGMIINADHENFAITAMTAIHLGQKVKSKLTSKETQDLLERLVEDKWIAQEEKGVYYLDTRAIAELQDYFREQYGEAIKECTICMDVVTMGEACVVSQCPVRLHKYCANMRFNNSDNPTCPQCSHSWDRSHTFGLGLPEDE